MPLLGANAAQKMGLLTVNYANIFDANDDNTHASAHNIASSTPFLQTPQDAIPETVMSATTEAPLSAADIENNFGCLSRTWSHAWRVALRR